MLPVGRLALVVIVLTAASAFSRACHPSESDGTRWDAGLDSCPAQMGPEFSTSAGVSFCWATLIDRASFGFVKLGNKPGTAPRRIEELLNQEWARFWFPDRLPDQYYERVEGGIQPD